MCHLSTADGSHADTHLFHFKYLMRRTVTTSIGGRVNIERAEVTDHLSR